MNQESGIKNQGRRKTHNSLFIIRNSARVANNSGFIALTTVLVMSAVILVISTGISLRSVDGIKMSLGQKHSYTASSLAYLCAENALIKLKSTTNYSGNETITLDGETCDILSIDGTGYSTRTVKTQSTVSGYTKKLKIVVAEVDPIMQITSWDEVTDF